MWQEMCDHIETTVFSVGGGCIPPQWHRRDGFIRELKERWEPMEDFMADYAVDFLAEVVQPHTQEPPALLVTSTRGRRSRAKSHRTFDAQGEFAADRSPTCLEGLAHWMDDVELPSDVEDRWW